MSYVKGYFHVICPQRNAMAQSPSLLRFQFCLLLQILQQSNNFLSLQSFLFIQILLATPYICRISLQLFYLFSLQLEICSLSTWQYGTKGQGDHVQNINSFCRDNLKRNVQTLCTFYKAPVAQYPDDYLCSGVSVHKRALKDT